MSSLQKTILKTKLPPSGMNVSSFSKANKTRLMHYKRDYEPVQWTQYFDKTESVTIDKSTFSIYIHGTEGPLLVLLHGGGYSALTWSEFTKSISTMIQCQIMAIDLRGHGNTHTDNDEDLSAHTLALDVAGIIAAIDNENSVVLVGHSMGGAVAVRAAPLIPNLSGVVVIDVVEGTAMDALTSMQSFLRSRPTSFTSIQQAIEWCVRSGQIRNLQSAKVSVPGQIKNIASNKLASDDTSSSTDVHEDDKCSSSLRKDIILEEEELHTPLPPAIASTTDAGNYTWRIDLAQTEKHWAGWFHGLSSAFLNVPAPKLLLLAGVDRLDKELMVGQMQGKFQMQVLPACGHAVHEDVPDKVAEAVATFMVRHKFAQPAENFSRPLFGIP